jgi:FlaA1/EpsC-like NDP-sugar epimerase
MIERINMTPSEIPPIRSRLARLTAFAEVWIGRSLVYLGSLDLLFRNRTLFLLDIAGWAAIPWIALAIRLDDAAAEAPYFNRTIVFAVWLILFQFAGLYFAGMYRRLWRYASLSELFSITAALTLGVIGATLADRIVSPMLLASTTQSLPRSVPIICAMLAVIWSGGTRFSLRYISLLGRRRRCRGKPALIFGAGDAGSMLARELQSNPVHQLEPIGLIDDHPAKHGQVISGIRVLGARNDLADAAKRYGVETVIIAMPTASGAVIRELRELCVAANLRVLLMPGIQTVLNGQTTLRKIQIEDLLRRDPVETDEAGIRARLTGMRVLVTGAGGSIGSELCRQLARLDARELILLGHGENSIFAIENEMRARFPDLQLSAVIADIRDPVRIEETFARFRPDAVFHAAAHKHVPLMETNPDEAVTNNVGGTRTVLAAAERWGSSHFVLISSDKAVNPVNVMGATKRMAEELVRGAAARTGRNYVSVRFGNVLGSRGSVIPTFEAQIAAGGPVNVTHPEVTRYFMTIPEAVQLTLQAATIGQCGETFVLDMRQPVKIVDLARDLIELCGLRLGHDIRIEFTGLRLGEKMYEELFLDSENHTRTSHEKIFMAPSRTAPSLWDHELHALIEVACGGDRVRTRQLLGQFAARIGGRLNGPALVTTGPTNSAAELRSVALSPN